MGSGFEDDRLPRSRKKLARWERFPLVTPFLPLPSGLAPILCIITCCPLLRLSTAGVISVQIAFQGGHPSFKDSQSVLRPSYGHLRWGTQTPWELSSAAYEGSAPLRGWGVKLPSTVSLWGSATVSVSHINGTQYQRQVCHMCGKRDKLLLSRNWPKCHLVSSIPIF